MIGGWAQRDLTYVSSLFKAYNTEAKIEIGRPRRQNREEWCWYRAMSTEHGRYHDNMFCLDADKVAAFMESLDKPWIAFKTMAAGAIPPRFAFPFAFRQGADFIVAGMFDFQLEQDAKLAIEALRKSMPGSGPGTGSLVRRRCGARRVAFAASVWDRGETARHGMLAITSLVFCFGVVWLAAATGLAPIVGAFAAGLILDERHYVRAPRG